MTELRHNQFVTLYKYGKLFVICCSKQGDELARFESYREALEFYRFLIGRDKRFLSEFSKATGGWGKRNAA